MADTNDWDDALAQMKQVEEQLQAQAQKQSKPKPKRGRGVLLIGIVVVLAIAGGVVFLLLNNNPPSPEPTIPQVIEADPMRFDPQISLETVQRFAGEDLRFYSLTMTQVKPDGTVDFSTGDSSSVSYNFLTSDDSEMVIVSVADDLSMSRSTEALSSGLTLPRRVDPPTCDIPQLWQLAKTYDAPDSGVADIHYDASGYNFTISSLEIDLQFNGDCILIRD